MLGCLTVIDLSIWRCIFKKILPLKSIYFSIDKIISVHVHHTVILQSFTFAIRGSRRVLNEICCIFNTKTSFVRNVLKVLSLKGGMTVDFSRYLVPDLPM